MRREILIALFILLLIFIYTEARAIALKSGLTICPDESTQTDECLPA